MSKLDSLVEEYKNEEVETTSTENDTPVENDSVTTPTEEPKVEEKDISEEQVQTELAPEDKPSKKELLEGKSELEKATHSFKTQLYKQKSRYESQISEMQKKFEERLDKLEHPEKYKEKFRADFNTDEEYINHILEQKWNKMMEDQHKKDEESYRIQEENKKIYERTEKFFDTEEKMNDYNMTVRNAFENGLQELMDKEGYVSNYIQQSEYGPKILYDMASNPELVKRIYSIPNPMDRLVELKMYEKSLSETPSQTAPNTPQATPEINTQKTTLKPIGRPGTSTGATGDMFSDKASLRNFLRGR